MRKLLLITVLLMLAFANSAQAKNPIMRYFARLLDETKAEMAVGGLIYSEFVKDPSIASSINYNHILSEKAKRLAENCPRPELGFMVYVMQSEIPDEICFPGGNIVLTSALLDSAKSEEQKEFIVARNVMLIALRLPMKLIKNEGLYARLLNQLKLPEDRRDMEEVRLLVKDYLRNVFKMDHQKADLQGILLTNKPEETRKQVIELLKTYSETMWPVMPWDRGDLRGRIRDLENLKLPN
jgi:hypothetical protein